MPLLSDDDISRALVQLEGWARNGNEISRTVRFPEFMAGIRFINRVAELAEGVDHHPDIDIRYRNVKFTLLTHDQGGLTEKDIGIARKINDALT